MAQSVDKPPDSGVISLPTVDAGMNRIAPTATTPKDQKAPVMLRPGERRKRNQDEEDEILQRARKRFDRCVQAESDNRRAGLEDDKFYAGEQWDSSVIADRNQANRPILTINKLPTFVHQVTNDQRQNRPAININPVGDRGDPEVAKMYRGMIRQIERASFADIAYDTAFDSAARKGWGYWRILTEYESQKSFNLVIRIARIRNAYTVYLDPNHQEPDGSDAKYGFITELIPRSDFEDMWPDADPMPWTQGGVGDAYKNWILQHEVRIAVYFELETEKRTLVMLSNGHVGWKDELSEFAKMAFEIEAEREADCPRVDWYKITAREIVEENDWPGKWIPIIKVIGDEIDIEGKVKLWGIVRMAKDPQRMYNYWKTTETELVALQPRAKWLVAEGQIEGYEDQWKQANNNAYPYLQYKPTTLGNALAPPPMRQQPEAIPASVVGAASAAAQDMMATTGIRFDATLGERVYDESGRALRELRERGDLGSFHLTDNLARSLRHCGEIMLDLIPKIYDTKRVATILREDDAEERVQLDPNSPRPYREGRDPQTGKALKIFNPTVGEYGVTVTVGPSYATKRIEAAESMMDFVRALPAAAPLIMDLIAKNADWPGGEEMATRLAKALPPGLITPDMKDVPPQVQAVVQQLQQQLQAMSQERQQLVAALTNQQADRAQRQDKIDKEFEAKLLAIVQKAEQSFNAHVGSQLKDLAEGVNLLRQTMTMPTQGLANNG